MFVGMRHSWRVLTTLLVIVLVLATDLASQAPSDAPDLQMYRRIREEGTARSHVMEYATELLDGIGPRLTGSPGLSRAVSWAMDRLTAAGSSRVTKES
ncbi:MAG TPA: hypothetical protein VKB36_08765, partial [Vicinamibacterales bacterium]|nr:hypothetical protein [Vicinamibacterales bacterium]